MDDDLCGIGEMARAAGLTVSALRFYDRAGVLVPAVVDPDTGYRRYAARQVAPARLLAGLRRVGMPLADIACVLAALPDAGVAHSLVDAHLHRLEDGLADARRALVHVHLLLDRWETTMSEPSTSISVAAADLASAFDAVRFAVSGDPALPVLQGVLVVVDDGVLEVVATDRYRLAVARVRASVTGPSVRVVAPVAFVDGVRERLEPQHGPVVLTLTPDALAADVTGHRLTGTAVPGEFPDHERLLRGEDATVARRRVAFDAAAVRAALAPDAVPLMTREHDGVPNSVAVLAVHPDRGVTVVDPSAWDAEDPGTVAVNPEFLLQALDAGGTGQLLLDLDGPVRPLAIRSADDEGRFSVLMPVRL